MMSSSPKPSFVVVSLSQIVSVVLLLVVSACLPSMTLAANGDKDCWLCGDEQKVPNDWYSILSDGQSCTQWYLYMYDNLESDSNECSKAQEYVSSCCCQDDGSIPEECEVGGTNEQATYTEIEKTGDYEQCYICDYTPYLYPGNPRNSMQVRYLGDYSCSELYTIGLQGKIPNYLCLPMQADDLLQETCGCSVKQGATYKGPNKGKWSIGRTGKKGRNNKGDDGANWFSSKGGLFGGKGNGNGGGSSNNGYNTKFAGGRMSAMEMLITLLVIVGILVWIAAIMKRTKRTRSLKRRESLETDLV